ncbi:MAG: hypothetical protein ACREBU_17750 [Nitrososphaera sp.]
MEDCQKLISEATASYKPIYDYSKFEDKDLLVFYGINTIWGCQCVVRVLEKKDLASFTKETAKKVSRIVHDPSPENMAELYSVYPDAKPLKFLVWLRLNQKDILRELDKRHRPFKVGRAFILMEEGKWQPKDVTDFHKLLKVEKISTYRPEKENAEDLKSDATAKAVEFFKRRGETIRVKQRPGMPIPAIPSEWGLPTTDPEPWGLWHRYQLDVYIENLLKDYLSLFFGWVDRVREAARQGLRDHWEKWEAQKRTGDEVILEETKKEIGLKSFKDWLENEQLRGEATPDISARMFQVLKEAKKRWGSRAVRALLFMSEGKSEKEAAELAKIPYQSFRRYVSKLKKEFSNKS